MAKRSFHASTAGIQQARRAFALTGWTQQNLVAEVNLKTRQPIWRFLTGKPVDRKIFMEICSVLDLEWRDIVENPPMDFREPGVRLVRSLETIETLNIETLVQQLRSQYHDRIQAQCGILHLLDINRPVNINDIYVDVNVLEDIASQQYFEISDLQHVEPEDVDRVGLGKIQQRQISGMQALSKYSKLRVLGKPGVGKTTFLQHLAIQCDRGTFASHHVPIFIVLREFAAESQRREFSLFHYIVDRLDSAGMSQASALETLLREGRVLLLLDGMDEVRNQDITAVLQEIRQFSEKYTKNQFVVSCRTGSRKFQFRGFTDVEVAPFTLTQITTFATKWFMTLTKPTARSGQDQSAQFIQKLKLPENVRLRKLVVTPLFLHLACWVFQGRGQFPDKQTDFYKQGLDLLLGKWDEARGVERDDIYKGFLVPQKLRLMSQLASVTFEHGQYFFEKHLIEQYISDYLQDLPGVNLEPEELQLESEAMLKSIEAQHGFLIERARGIFSFSYLAFHKYFTARKIVASHNLQELEQSLGRLVSHLTDPHWHGVFLLTTEMLRNADLLMQLMKQHIDTLVAQDPYLQEFLAIGHSRKLDRSWKFSPEQHQILQRYYDANQLLIDCLNSDCEVTPAIRQDIEATLLLPQKQLEDYEWRCECFELI